MHFFVSAVFNHTLNCTTQEEQTTQPNCAAIGQHNIQHRESQDQGETFAKAVPFHINLFPADLNIFNLIELLMLTFTSLTKE